MSRIVDKFDELKQAGRKAFIPFVTAGDPDFDTSVQIALEIVRAGGDILELGVPFSDPIADGPTIQASSRRALEKGLTLEDVLRLIAVIRRSTDVPIVVFSYFNPILRYGIERFASDAEKVGVDGLLLTDVIDDEAAKVSALMGSHGIDLISLVAPTTSDDRLEGIAVRAKGFVYAVARAGVTGASGELASDAEHLVRRLRRVTELPIAVGFGISARSQIEKVWSYADGAVVGSAIVREIENSLSDGDAVDAVRRFVDRLVPKVAKDAVEI